MSRARRLIDGTQKHTFLPTQMGESSFLVGIALAAHLPSQVIPFSKQKLS